VKASAAAPALGRLERRKARTVAAILDAAERHFLERGYEATKVDEIAADADVAVGSLYNHFGSKDGLYAALLEHALETFESYMAQEAPPDLTPLELILDVTGRLARFGRERPGEMRVLCLPQPRAPHEPLSEVVEQVASTMAAQERRTAALIEAARRQGMTRPVHSRDAAAFLWAAWKGMLTLGPRAERAAPGHDRELRRLLEAAVRIVIGGLASDTSRQQDDTVRAILESAPAPAGPDPVKRPVELKRSAVEGSLREEFPELALWTAEVHAGTGDSPPAVRRRLDDTTRRLTAAAAIGDRGESTPWAYRVFARRLGIDPDEPQRAVEAAALRKGAGEWPPAGDLVEDALLIAVAQTGVPVLAFDAAELDGELWLRRARAGERLAGDSRAIPEGRPVLSATVRAVAAPFGPVDAAAPVTAGTERIALAALQVKGVPEMSVEEALWTVVEILREAA
jgi:TetR/AcrR family transcriptional regulator